MKVTIKEFMFNGPALDSEAIEVPTDLDSVKEWLDEYGMEYADDNDVRKVYIRTRLFQTFDVSYTIDKSSKSNIEINKLQRYAIDIFDNLYKSYETVNVKISYPETFDCIISEEDIHTFSHYGDDAESMDLAIYDYLSHYLPVTIEIL